MPSLVIDARMIDASGIGVYLKNIIPYLVEEFEVTLLGDKEKLRAFSWSGRVKIIQLTAPIYSLKEQWGLRASIPACDVFWSPHYNIPLLPIPAKKRVVTIHDTYHLAFRHTLSIAQKAFATVFLNAAVCLSDLVLTVSEFSREQIVHFTNAKKQEIKVIPNAVQPELFRQIPKEQAQEALKKVLPALPAHYFLYVGNVKPHKNLKTLLEAYTRLPKRVRQQYKIVIVGKKEGFITSDNELLKVLQNNSVLEESICFTGYVPDESLPLLYNCASLFVFPSYYEGFGLPPLEAMACGCPVIASDAASIPEICGDAALYFPPQDAEALSRQLLKVVENRLVASELVAKGLEQSKKYAWLTSGQEHSQAFKKLLAVT